jgi:hypothetical protein
MKTLAAQVITPEDLLKHWQGHRALTRRVIELFPEKDFFEFSIGGMRTFAKLTDELLAIAVPGLKLNHLTKEKKKWFLKRNILKNGIRQQKKSINTGKNYRLKILMKPLIFLVSMNFLLFKIFCILLTMKYITVDKVMYI